MHMHMTYSTLYTYACIRTYSVANTNLCGCACYIVCVETYDSLGQWTSSSMSAAVLSLLCDICRDVSIGRHPIGKREVWLMDQ